MYAWWRGTDVSTVDVVQMHNGSNTDARTVLQYNNGADVRTVELAQMHAERKWYRCTHGGSSVEVRIVEIVQRTPSGKVLKYSFSTRYRCTHSGSGTSTRTVEMVEYTIKKKRLC